MNINKLIISCILLFIGQILVWFQLYGPLKIEAIRGSKIFAYSMAIPITLFFLQGTRIGFESLNNTMWPVRFLTFSLGVISFTFLTWKFNNESIDLKTGICLALSILIIMIQIFWKQ